MVFSSIGLLLHCFARAAVVLEVLLGGGLGFRVLGFRVLGLGLRAVKQQPSKIKTLVIVKEYSGRLLIA